MSSQRSSAQNISYTDFVELLEQDKVLSLAIRDNLATIRTKEQQTVKLGNTNITSKTFTTLLPNFDARDPKLLPLLTKKNIALTERNTPAIIKMFTSALPVLVVLWFIGLVTLVAYYSKTQRAGAPSPPSKLSGKHTNR